jgi:soluble lytic murein transglycosylase-like protein
LLLQYQGSTFKALAAYNAGEGAVQKYGGIPPYRETRDYVERVVRNYYKLSGSKTQ